MSGLLLWGGLICLLALPAIGASGVFNTVGAVLMIIGWILLLVGR